MLLVLADIRVYVLEQITCVLLFYENPELQCQVRVVGFKNTRIQFFRSCMNYEPEIFVFMSRLVVVLCSLMCRHSVLVPFLR